jgi:hypothetical protein
MEIVDIEDIEVISRHFPDLHVCGSDSTFSLLRLQCRATIVADPSNGPTVSDSAHDMLCIASVKKAKQLNADVFLTPEYAFSTSVLTKIVEDEEYQPGHGKLWCIGTQAISCTVFEQLLTKWEQQGITVVWDSFSRANHRQFINTLVYIFRLTNGMCCVVPQLKTYPMADHYLNCEQAGMSRGNTVFRFGKNRKRPRSRFLLLNNLMSPIIPESWF